MVRSFSGQLRTRNAAITIAAFGMMIVGVFLLRTFDPAGNVFYPKCFLHEWTGLHCPGCGTTRALAALTHGRLADAVRSNPLLILGGPIIVAAVLLQRRRERRGASAAPRLAWTVFFVLVVYFVARNVPSPNRSWLAPPATVDAESSADA